MPAKDGFIRAISVVFVTRGFSVARPSTLSQQVAPSSVGRPSCSTTTDACKRWFYSAISVVFVTRGFSVAK